MDSLKWMEQYWQAVLNQDAEEISKYFQPDAAVYWHNSNECFTVEEFIRANCEYPGEWEGRIECRESMGDKKLTIVHTYTTDRSMSFRVVSIYEIEQDKIKRLDEYWGEDGEAPLWRQEKHIGIPIRSK